MAVAFWPLLPGTSVIASTRFVGYFRKPLATGGRPFRSGVTMSNALYLGSTAVIASVLVAVPAVPACLLQAVSAPPPATAAALRPRRVRNCRRVGLPSSPTGRPDAAPISGWSTVRSLQSFIKGVVLPGGK